jgi:hypothetical protein
MSNVFSKLNQARTELQRRELKKSGRNKFANYSYFELGDFLPTVQEIFAQIGLCGVVSYGAEEAILKIIDTESTDSFIDIRSPMSSAALKGAHDIQNLGAVQTYLRRYLWVTAMEIVEHDELDATLGAARDSAKAAPEPEKVSQGRRSFKPGDSVAPAVDEPVQRLLEIKAHDMGITPFGIKTILTICKADSIEQIEDGKAKQIYEAINPELVKKFNSGKNSKNQVILQPPVAEVKSENIEDLERAASSLFEDGEGE